MELWVLIQAVCLNRLLARVLQLFLNSWVRLVCILALPLLVELVTLLSRCLRYVLYLLDLSLRLGLHLIDCSLRAVDLAVLLEVVRTVALWLSLILRDVLA